MRNQGHLNGIYGVSRHFIEYQGVSGGFKGLHILSGDLRGGSIEVSEAFWDISGGISQRFLEFVKGVRGNFVETTS